jgi:UDP-N-acetylglucosamine 2-epimerase (non-hydrolysing)
VPGVLLILGTRPEVIKLAPLVLYARQQAWPHQLRVLATGQHRELVHQALSIFGITADADLDLMTPGQTLPGFFARALPAIDAMLGELEPDALVFQGDTSTVLAAALAGFYRRIPILAHVEAGLRSHNRMSPYPEEMNRVLAGRLATVHFAPTPSARQNLLAEGIDPHSIHVTGNTVIDALFYTLGRVRRQPPSVPGLPPDVLTPHATGSDDAHPMMLVTAHRRENFGEGIEAICRAVLELARLHPTLRVVYPVHPNPAVHGPAHQLLAGHPRIHLIAPVDYREFVHLMDRATLILTDSGGVQEEAPSLGKPVLVMRDNTERPEAVEAGTVLLVGAHTGHIVAEAHRLLSDAQARAAMARAINPYGDGHAAPRILEVLHRLLPPA